ncbi:exodeoxyribonuclease I [Guyparkeria hydrothermalis]|uniref:exodeoxyribonuclease I n=1 Tax=Guyparkeria hydrothermalis TaxID=923 RepID=UPI0020227C21|nr:exodeoxyribonuclease I [Guyparkeria hydrothermalis]MCL7752049.1 exodeoxyribonuclease I [Guyparkeria hydrothermalis]
MSVATHPPSFLFFDLETTGADPVFDRPLQFAAIRTDMALEPIGEPVVWYARPPDDCLAHPAAVMTTGLLPDDPVLAGADSEANLANRIHRLVSQPNTCVVGFNNLRFDAPMLRFLFWRNLLDPYRHEWEDGNSRFDVLDAARAYRLLAPSALNWPVDGNGHPTLRLSELSAANGLTHENAHDALSDVEATIDLARALRNADPALWERLLAARDKREVARVIDQPGHVPFLHVSPRLPARVASASMFCSFGQVDGNRNRRECWDLRFDPLPWLDLHAGQWAERRFLKSPPIEAERDWDELRLPIKSIHLNRVPVVLPAETLERDGVAQRMVIDRARIEEHAASFRRHVDALRERLIGALEQTEGDFPPRPAEQSLYAGFVPNADRRHLEDWWGRARGLRSRDEAIAHARDLLVWPFEDPRLPELAEGFVARNLPEALDDAARERWRARLVDQLRPGQRLDPGQGQAPGTDRDFPAMFAEVERLATDEHWSPEQRALLGPYRRWLEQREQALKG